MNGNDDGRRTSQPPPSSFVMPGDRAHGASATFVAPIDRPSALPPPYHRSDAPNSNRRLSQQLPPPPPLATGPPPQAFGALQPNNHPPPNPPSHHAAATMAPADLSIESYKTILKEWKRHHTAVTMTLASTYTPLFTRRLARLEPDLQSLLRPLCPSPTELQICMTHWEQETQHLPTLALQCAKTMHAAVRDAWNELVIIPPDQAPDVHAMMNRLHGNLEEAYDRYTKSLYASKENLWHTLDFNVDFAGVAQRELETVRERFCGGVVFDGLKLGREELQSCGLLPVLVVPEVEEQGGGRGAGPGHGGGGAAAHHHHQQGMSAERYHR